MMAILKRVHEKDQDGLLDGAEDNLELDSDDDEDCEELEERLKGVDLDDADEVWSKLNDAEKQEFKAFLR